MLTNLKIFYLALLEDFVVFHASQLFVLVDATSSKLTTSKLLESLWIPILHWLSTQRLFANPPGSTWKLFDIFDRLLLKKWPKQLPPHSFSHVWTTLTLYCSANTIYVNYSESNNASLLSSWIIQPWIMISALHNSMATNTTEDRLQDCLAHLQDNCH